MGQVKGPYLCERQCRHGSEGVAKSLFENECAEVLCLYNNLFTAFGPTWLDCVAGSTSVDSAAGGGSTQVGSNTRVHRASSEPGRVKYTFFIYARLGLTDQATGTAMPHYRHFRAKFTYPSRILSTIVPYCVYPYRTFGTQLNMCRRVAEGEAKLPNNPRGYLGTAAVSSTPRAGGGTTEGTDVLLAVRRTP